MDSLVFHALDKASIGMIVVNGELEIVIWNKWLERYTGRNREEVLGRRLTDMAPRFGIDRYLDILRKALHHGQSRFCSSTLHKAFILPKNVEDENACKQNVHIEPLNEGNESYALIQINDLTNMYDRVFKLKSLIKELELEYNQIKTSEEISRHLSLHDSLTGLPNRLAFGERLAWAINYAERNRDKLAIMFIDVDGFKAVNDTYGHDMGDVVLIEAARRIRECMRNTDTVARLGGDEFSAVATQLKDAEDASVVAGKIVGAFERPFQLNGTSVNLSISLGISLCPEDGQEPAELLRKADLAMYRIKSQGKNGFGFFRSH